MRLGVDYSDTTKDWAAFGKALITKGYTFTGRYLAPGNPKGATAAELAAHRALGIEQLFYYENDTGDALGGRSVGAANAAKGLTRSHDLGIPPAVAIYFAVDFEPTTRQMVTVLDYFRGIGSVLPLSRIGAYGGLATIKALFDAHLITYAVQTEAWSGHWPNKVFDPRAQVRQWTVHGGFGLMGIGCDKLEAVVADFGQWHIAAPVPQPTPTPPIPEDDVIVPVDNLQNQEAKDALAFLKAQGILNSDHDLTKAVGNGQMYTLLARVLKKLETAGK